MSISTAVQFVLKFASDRKMTFRWKLISKEIICQIDSISLIMIDRVLNFIF